MNEDDPIKTMSFTNHNLAISSLNMSGLSLTGLTNYMKVAEMELVEAEKNACKQR